MDFFSGRTNTLKNLSILPIVLALMTGCGGGGGGGDDTPNSGDNSGSPNQPPVAMAGADQVVTSGSLVTLDGSSSFDADGNIISYSWSQSSGQPSLSIQHTNTDTASFNAPNVAIQTRFVFQLQVRDDSQAQDSDTLTVTVQPQVASTDYSQLTGPVILGSADTPDTAESVAVYGSYAYVADWESGLQIIDVTNPLNPLLVSFINTADRATDVAISDDGATAYIADNGGIYAIDITSPETPVIAQHLQSGIADYYATALDIENDRLYAARDDLMVFDVSNPSNMRLLGRIALSVSGASQASDLQVAGGIVYMANNTDGMSIWDARNPSNIVAMGSADSENRADAIFYTNNRLYMTDQEAGTKIYDVSNPSIPSLEGVIPTNESLWAGFEASNIWVEGDTAYVAADAAIQVWDIQDSNAPSLIGQAKANGGGNGGQGMQLVGDLIYIISSAKGLQIIDISDPASAPLLREPNISFLSQLYSFSNNKAYTARTWLESIDIKAPDVQNRTTVPIQASHSYVQADIAYSILTGSGSLNISNISDQDNPVTLSLTTFPASVNNIRNQILDKKNDQLLIGNGSGVMHLVNVSDPTNPVVNTIDLTISGYNKVLGINGDNVYVQKGSDELALIDISDQANIVEIGSLETSANHLLVDGDYLYLSGVFGFRIMDISSPSSPTLIAEIEEDEITNRISKNGDFIFVGTGQSGAGRGLIVDVKEPEFPRYTHLATDGKNSAGALSEGNVAVFQASDKLSVYDVSGYFD